MDTYFIIDISEKSSRDTRDSFLNEVKQLPRQRITVVLVSSHCEIIEIESNEIERIFINREYTGSLNLYDALNWVYYRILDKKNLTFRISLFLTSQPSCDVESLIERTKFFKLDLKYLSRQTNQKINSKLTVNSLDRENLNLTELEFSIAN